MMDEALSPMQEAVAQIAAEDKAAAAAAETPTSSPEPVAAEPAADGAAPPDGTTEPPKPVARKPKVEPWMQARLDEKTFKQREAERRADAAEQRANAAEALAAQLAKPPQTEGEEPPKPVAKPAAAASDEFVPKGEVDRRAAEMQAAREFSAETYRVLQEGKTAFPGGAFEEALAPLQAMGATDRMDFLEAAFATGEAHKVLHHLGNDPERASSLLKLSPVRMAAEMAKIAALAANPPKAAPAPVSSAPRPPQAIQGTARNEFDPADPKVSMDAFSDWFDRELGPKIIRRAS